MEKMENNFKSKKVYGYDIPNSFLGEKKGKKCVYVPMECFGRFDINTVWLSETREFKEKWPNINLTGEWDLSPAGEKTEHILFFYK